MTQSLVSLFMLSPLCSVPSGCVEIDTKLNVWGVWQASVEDAVYTLTKEVHCCWCCHLTSMSQSVSMHICSAKQNGHSS